MEVAKAYAGPRQVSDIPGYGLLVEIVTCLAKEFGWTRHYILEELYWDEIWIYYKKIQNDKVIDIDTRRKWEHSLHGSLHVGKKEAGKWRSFWNKWKLKLPFPGKKTVPRTTSAQHRMFARSVGQSHIPKISKEKYNATHRRH